MEITFSVNTHDSDGVITDNCILLHINDTFILRLSDIEELDSVIKNLQNFKTELVEYYE